MISQGREPARIEVEAARLVPLAGRAGETVVLVGDGRLAAFDARTLDPRWTAALPVDGAAALFDGRVVHASAESPATLVLRDAQSGEVRSTVDLPRRVATPEEASESAPAMRAAEKAKLLVGGRPWPWRGSHLCAADRDRVVVACAPVATDAPEGIATLVTLDASDGLGSILAEREKPLGTELFAVRAGPRLLVTHGFDGPLSVTSTDRDQLAWQARGLGFCSAVDDEAMLVIPRREADDRARDPEVRELTSLEVASGRARWTRPGPPTRRYAYGSGLEATWAGAGLAICKGDRRLLAVTHATGETRWSRELRDPIWRIHAGPDDVYAVCFRGGDDPGDLDDLVAGGSLVALDLATGAARWSAPLGPEFDPHQTSLIPTSTGVVLASFDDDRGTELRVFTGP